MRASHLRSAIAIGRAFLAFAILSFGCGNPEAPKIENVRVAYWDFLMGEGSWIGIDEGKVAHASPVRIQGNVSDNTAVVSPRITWIGERNGVDDEGFTECSNGTDEFYECVMDCQGPTAAGYFECDPVFDAPKLIRGDRFLLNGTQAGGETFELEVSVSEAQKLKDNNQAVDIEYRIFRVSSLEGDPGVIWSAYQRTDCGTWGRESAEDCKVDEPSSAWRALQSGDSLCWHPAVEEERNCSFQIALKQTDGGDAIDSVNATWRSLVKWNDSSYLNWDARTGDFEEIFQIFDPRVRDPNSDEVIGEEGAPTYRFVVSARDVPDQKTGVYRSSEEGVDLIFSPQMATRVPDLEVEGEDEDLIETSDPAENIRGRVESFNGEVRSLLYTLSDGPEGNGSRILYIDSDSISLQGRFLETVVFVSDWNGDGVVDPRPEGEGIPNFLEVVALDVQGNWTRTPVSIVFIPTTKADKVPELQMLEIFPTLDDEGETLLPFGEELRLRARAADDRGQPEFSGWECPCNAEEPLINDYRCPCSRVVAGELNAGGEFPANPWEWIVFRPASEVREDIVVLRAKEKVGDPKDLPVAKSSAIQIDLEPESEEEAYRVSVSLKETVGPTVVLTNLKNGDPVKRDDFSVQATIFPHLSGLNQITALWNQKPRGAPSYDSEKGVFSWDFQGETVNEGDRICVGAISVTGHATMNLLEFAAITDTDELLLGVTVTSDTQECGVESP